MKRICFITTVSMTLNAFVKDFAEYLYKNGDFEIYFICDQDEEFRKSLPEYINYIPVRMKRGLSFDGVKVIRRLYKIFKENKFDMIQYSTPNASCYASIAGWLAKIPVRLYCQWGIAYVGFKGIKRCIFKIIEKLNCSLSTWIEPDSHSNLDFCHQEGLYPMEKGAVIWNGSASGVNLTKFDINNREKWRNEIRSKYMIPESALVYIFIGRITHDKGINELFLAANKLLRENEDVYLLLVGSNEADEGINQELLEWSYSEGRVIYTGFTTEVERYVAAADIYVLPSYREGFGSAVIEAEAMGIPVIVTNIPGPINAMQNEITGLIVDKQDENSLYDAMNYLRENIAARETMGKQAYDYVLNNFEQQQLFEKMLADRMELMK